MATATAAARMRHYKKTEANLLLILRQPFSDSDSHAGGQRAKRRDMRYGDFRHHENILDVLAAKSDTVPVSSNFPKELDLARFNQRAFFACSICMMPVR
jgi:hypothetical protein